MALPHAPRTDADALLAAAPVTVGVRPVLDPALAAGAILARLDATLEAATAPEQEVLRACLVIAGARLPLLGELDEAFEQALIAFRARFGLQPPDGALDPVTVAAVLVAARRAVGGWTSLGARLRASWFDAFVLPGLATQAPGVIALVRALRGARS